MKQILKMPKIIYTDDFNLLIEKIMENPIIRLFVKNTLLKNENLLKNECYEIYMNDNETLVYINEKYLTMENHTNEKR